MTKKIITRNSRNRATVAPTLAGGEPEVNREYGSMKHLTSLTKSYPALAITDGHPSIVDSISEFLKDPVGVIELHLQKR